MQELGLDLVFHHARAAGLHRAPVCAGRNFRGALHEADFLRPLEQAHLVQDVVEGDELTRGVHAVAALGADFIHPVHQVRVEIRIAPHAVEHLVAVLQQTRQDFVNVVNGEGVVGAVDFARVVKAGAPTFPGFLFRIALAAEQNKFPVLAARHQHHHRLGLGEMGEVIKIAVGAVGIMHVAIAQAHRRGRQNGHAAPHVAHQRLAPLLENLKVHVKHYAKIGGGALAAGGNAAGCYNLHSPERDIRRPVACPGSSRPPPCPHSAGMDLC